MIPHRRTTSDTTIFRALLTGSSDSPPTTAPNTPGTTRNGDKSTEKESAVAGSLGGLVSERRLSFASKWFCERLLRVKGIPQTEEKSPSRKRKVLSEEELSEDLVSHFQALRPISSEPDESETLQGIIQGFMDRAHLSFAILGEGAPSVLNSLLQTSCEGLAGTLNAADFLLPSREGDMLLAEERGAKSPPIVLRYGKEPKITTKCRSGTSSVSHRRSADLRRFTAKESTVDASVQAIRTKLNEEMQSADAKVIEVRLPCEVLKGQREFFYFDERTRGENLPDSVHCVLCVVDELGLTSSLRDFLTQSGFLQRVIRHPHDFQLLFLLDRPHLGGFSHQDFCVLMRKQYSVLLQEHAPGPYSLIAPRLASNAEMVPIEPQRFTALSACAGAVSAEVAATGLPFVRSLLTSVSLFKCAPSIKNISNDWMRHSAPISANPAPAARQPSPLAQPMKRRGLVGDAGTLSLEKTINSIKKDIISGERLIDRVLAQSAVHAHEKWLKNPLANCNDWSSPVLSREYMESLNILVNQSMKTCATPNWSEQLLIHLPSQLAEVATASTEFLSSTLRASATLPNVRETLRKRSEYCQQVQQLVVRRVEEMSNSIKSIQVSQLVNQACHDVCVATQGALLALAGDMQGGSPLLSTDPSLMEDRLHTLPERTIQQIRLNFAEIASSTISSLTQLEEGLLECRQKVLSAEFNSFPTLPFCKDLPSRFPESGRATIPFRPLTNLLLDTSEWSLLSFLKKPLVADLAAFYQYLHASGLRMLKDTASKESHGPSQFRVMAQLIYGSESMHPVVRFLLCHEILSNPQRYQPYFMAAPRRVQEYISQMLEPHQEGDHITLLAFVNLYQVNVRLYSPVLHSKYVTVASSYQSVAEQVAPHCIAYADGNRFYRLEPLITSSTVVGKRSRFEFEDEEMDLDEHCKRPRIEDAEMSGSVFDTPTRSSSWSPSTGICTLQDLCVQSVVRNINLLPPLGGALPSELVGRVLRETLQQGKLDDQVLSRLLDGSCLESLNLSGAGRELTFACCQAIAHHLMPSLSRFYARSCCYLPREALSILLGSEYVLMKNQLRVIDLSGCSQLDNNSLQCIPTHCHQLESLNLSRCPLLRDTTVFDVLEACHQLHTLQVAHCTQLTDQAFLASKSPLVLRELDLTSCELLTNQTVAAVALRAQAHVESLKVSGPAFTDEMITPLATHCPQLKSLVMRYTSITDKGLRTLSEGCLYLQTLALPGSDNLSSMMVHPASGTVRDEGSQSRSFPHLSSLDVSNCANVDDTTLEAIAFWLAPMECLNLFGCIKISDGPLIRILQKAGAHLKQINLGRCERLTDVSMVQVCFSCPSLEKCCVSSCPGITDLGVSHLAQARNLLDLDLSWCPQLTEESLCQLRLPSLVSLQLHEISLSDEALAQFFRTCTMLRTLEVTFSEKIGPATLQSLSRFCTRLTSLNLSYCPSITVDSLQSAIAHMPALRELRLRGCPSLQRKLVVHNSLVFLDVSWCDQLLDSALVDIPRLCPALQVLDVSWCPQLSPSVLQSTSRFLRSLVASKR